jgi:hypothetical protein
LDYEGIAIFQQLSGVFKCEPFVEAYQAMLQKADGVVLAKTKSGQYRHEGLGFLSAFDQGDQLKIMSILEADNYIPQEILTLNDF